MKRKILVIGCGFAGLSAVRYLARFSRYAEVTALDKKDTFDFLPMLPDIFGRDVNPAHLTYPIKVLSEKWGFAFVNAPAVAVDLERNVVSTLKEKINYDYLVIASGSETNFYGNEDLRKRAYKLDDASDARRLLSVLGKADFDSFLISGGGYTGIEMASNLSLYFRRRHLKKKIAIIERAPEILGPLPSWIKDYVQRNLEAEDTDVFTNTVVERIGQDGAYLSNGRVFNRTLLLWVAGVRTADFIQGLNAEKNPQGRTRVDAYLRLRDNCFVSGDCAYVLYKQSFLRMAVQFAISQGINAAANIIKDIRHRRLDRYRPLDIGYIIPMANNRSCGRVAGLGVRGLPATLMHFTMCIYRSLGVKNKCGIIRDLMRIK